ncbi:MAG TPA: peptidase U35, partial [Oceanicaulis sp.]|nr:peptidase U35 [Oceanicaulis sp.]
DLVCGLITGNPDMSDGTAVFHANHANLATAGAITIANLGTARTLMRNQRSLAPDDDTDGTLLNLEPAFLAVPAELETVALQYTRQTSVVTDPEKQNVYAGSMQPIIEPRLASLSGGSADDWYLFASPNQVDIIEFAYLEGEQGPQIEQMEDFDTDGIKLKGRLDVGAAWIDHRGAVKNPGS